MLLSKIDCTCSLTFHTLLPSPLSLIDLSNIASGVSGPFPLFDPEDMVLVPPDERNANPPSTTRDSLAFSWIRSLSPSLSMSPPVGSRATKTCRSVTVSTNEEGPEDDVLDVGDATRIERERFDEPGREHNREIEMGNAARAAAERWRLDVLRQVLSAFMRPSVSWI